MKLNEQKLAHTLAALRWSQIKCDEDDDFRHYVFPSMLHFSESGYKPLNSDEVDALCSDLNSAGEILLVPKRNSDPYELLEAAKAFLVNAHQQSVDPELTKFIETAICVVADGLDRKKRIDKVIKEVGDGNE